MAPEAPDSCGGSPEYADSGAGKERCERKFQKRGSEDRSQLLVRPVREGHIEPCIGDEHRRRHEQSEDCQPVVDEVPATQWSRGPRRAPRRNRPTPRAAPPDSASGREDARYPIHGTMTIAPAAAATMDRRRRLITPELSSRPFDKLIEQSGYLSALLWRPGSDFLGGWSGHADPLVSIQASTGDPETQSASTRRCLQPIWRRVACHDMCCATTTYT